MYTEGTLGFLRGRVRWHVFLARGCDTLKVSVCEGLLGRDLYEEMRRAGDGARALLTLAKWPVPITSRMAYGFAAAAHGGRSCDMAPECALRPRLPSASGGAVASSPDVFQPRSKSFQATRGSLTHRPRNGFAAGR